MGAVGQPLAGAGGRLAGAGRYLDCRLPLERRPNRQQRPQASLCRAFLPAGSKHVQTKFESKDKKKHEPGKLVKGRNEPCAIVQVRAAVISGDQRPG